MYTQNIKLLPDMSDIERNRFQNELLGFILRKFSQPMIKCEFNGWFFFWQRYESKQTKRIVALWIATFFRFVFLTHKLWIFIRLFCMSILCVGFLLLLSIVLPFFLFVHSISEFEITQGDHRNEARTKSSQNIGNYHWRICGVLVAVFSDGVIIAAVWWNLFLEW